LPLCFTNTPNVLGFALYEGHLETGQCCFSVKPWHEVAFFGSCMGINLLAEIRKVEGGWMKSKVKRAPWF